MKKLGFGLMRLPVIDGKPDNIDLNTLSQMVDLYLERGFTYFDTSYVYHNGASETAIREALVKRHDRRDFLLASKFPTFIRPAEDQVENIFQEQLDKCGVVFRLLSAAQPQPRDICNRGQGRAPLRPHEAVEGAGQNKAHRLLIP